MTSAIERPRRGRRAFVGALLATCLSPWRPAATAATGKVDPATVVPMHLIAPDHQATVAEVIRSPSFHRKGAPDTFPANPRIYLTLVNQPVLTLALWKDLAASPAELRQVGPDTYSGSDGDGTSAVWQYLVRGPQAHVLLCNIQYAAPRGGPRLDGRLVLVVRSSFLKEPTGEPWVRHEIEVFAKVDSRGWRAVAATLRPVVERVLKEQVDEAGLFVSLMARLVEVYPDWAAGVARAHPGLTAESRDEFVQLVQETRRPGAFAGRPVVAGDPATRRASAVRR
jgi:hypothetical protein